jgi:1-deoxy-D-xylulose-5-phosphate reductoisomerase
VEFKDGSVLAQLSPPDMRLPIQYAMTYPERAPRVVERLDLFRSQELTFRKPDFGRFPCLELARQAALKGGGLPAVLNAADEVAVESFIAGRLPFTGIARVVERVMTAYRGGGGLPGFSEVVEIDGWARAKAREVAARI